MPHAYVTPETLRGTGALNLGTGTGYDVRLRGVVEAVSKEIDRYVVRTFQPQVRTRTFDGDASTLLLVPDLIAVTTLKEDNNEDGTFDTTWNANDYILRPLNADPTEDYGRPYTSIMVSPKSNGTQDEFLAGPQRYEIDGTWGWNAVTRLSAVAASGSLDSTGTSLTVDTAGLEPGQTIIIDSEQIYIRETATTAITAARGVNGSTAGTHGSRSAINYYVYPEPIVEAAIIQAARLWKRKDSGFADQIGFPETGVMVTFRGFDADVKHYCSRTRG